MVQPHPLELSSIRLHVLCAIQEVEVQAEDLFPPLRHQSLIFEQCSVNSNEYENESLDQQVSLKQTNLIFRAD